MAMGGADANLGIDFNDFDCHEPSAIDQFSTSPVNKPSIPNVKDCFKQLTHEEVKQQICDAENRNTLKKTMVDVNKFKRFLLTKQEKREIHNIDPDTCVCWTNTWQIMCFQLENVTVLNTNQAQSGT